MMRHRTALKNAGTRLPAAFATAYTILLVRSFSSLRDLDIPAASTTGHEREAYAAKSRCPVTYQQCEAQPAGFRGCFDAARRAWLLLC